MPKSLFISLFFLSVLVISCRNANPEAEVESHSKKDTSNSSVNDIKKKRLKQDSIFKIDDADQINRSKQGERKRYFGKAPIPALEIPFQTLKVSSEKLVKHTFESGASIEFPVNCFLNENGKVIKGRVDVSLREFNNSLDFFLADIPMQFDSAGRTYTFESAGMFEVIAKYQGREVFVNPASKPRITLRAQALKSGNQIYHLDPLTQQWELEKEALELITPINEMAITSFDLDSRNDSIAAAPRKPIKPVKVDLDKEFFDVYIPYSKAYEELSIFSKVKFQIDESEKKYNPAEADQEWDKVDLKETNTEGLYVISFTRRDRKISYRVRPVYKEEDLDAAMQTYLNKKQDYEVKMSDWLKKEERRKKVMANNKKEEMVKSQFAINSFGIWNCDRLIQEYPILIIADFIDANGEKIKLSNINVLSEEPNALYRFYSNKIRISEQKPFVIIGFKDEKLYYRPLGLMDKKRINSSDQSVLIKMELYHEPLNSYESLSKALGL